MSGVLLALVNGLKFLEGISTSVVSDGLGRDSDCEDSCYPSDHASDNHPDLARVDISPTTMVVEALLLPLYQSGFFYPILLLLTLLSLLRLQYNRLKEVIRTTSPIPDIPSVPNAHPLFGHYSLLMDPDMHSFIFREHATPSGISSIWGPGLKRCASVLQASHARLVLRQTSQRDFSEWIIRHGRKTLGEDSLILIPGGSYWKGVRKIVARAFTHDVVRDQRKVIGRTARELVEWLESSCDIDDPIEAKDFFKLYSFSVFGKTSMGYDFQSIPKEGGESRRRPSSSRDCMPPEAVAFESLNQDIGQRATKLSSLMNPAMQLYWIPSRINREYWKNTTMVNEMMGRIIGNHMDGMLRSSSQRRENSPSEKCSAGQNAGLRSSLLTYLIQTCMEKHFSKESSSACPFAASSSRPTSSSSSFDASSFKNMTQIARRKIIQDVSSILHTLLLAGYETTALSLSYAMYCLARNPRCQDRCYEEARRVLKRKKNGGSNDVSFDSNDGDADGDDLFDSDDDDLPYCRAVLTEAIRLNMPVVFTTRVISKDLTLETGNDDDKNGKASRCTILKGTRIILNPEMIHRDERNFVRATEFVPERWVRWDSCKGGWVDRDYNGEGKYSTEDAPLSAASTVSMRPSAQATFTSPPSSEYTIENSKADCIPAANPANFFAFSDGARNCVGRRLAIMESTLLIAELLRDLHVGFADENFKLVKEISFVTVQFVSMPIKFWKR